MILLLILLSYFEPQGTPLQEADKFTVVIDASHGGPDKGARSDQHGLIESKLSLRLAEMLSNEFDDNYEIILLRTSDESLSDSKRAEMVNKMAPDLYLSFHFGHDSGDKEFGMYSHFGAQETFKEDSEYYAGFFLEELLELDEMLPVQQPSMSNDPILNKINAPGVMLHLGSFENVAFNEFLTKRINLAEISYLLADAIRGIQTDQ